MFFLDLSVGQTRLIGHDRFEPAAAYVKRRLNEVLLQRRQCCDECPQEALISEREKERYREKERERETHREKER